MNENFDVGKIVMYLEKYKSDIQKIYNWKVNLDSLYKLGIFNETQIDKMKLMEDNFSKGIELKKIIGQKFNEIKGEDTFNELCLWIIKDWGGIKSLNETETLELIKEYLKNDNLNFKRIASISKIASFIYPEKNVIYDSRVAYSLN